MKTASTGSGSVARVQKPPCGSAANNQWWKAWALLISLGATVFGWMAFASGEPPVEKSAIVVPEAPLPTRVAPVSRVTELDKPSPIPPGARTLPAMPSKPVFQSPVTRTRRS